MIFTPRLSSPDTRAHTYDDLAVVVDVLSAPPAAGTDAWDQVVKASIGVPTARPIIRTVSSATTRRARPKSMFRAREAVLEIAEHGGVRLVQYHACSGPVHQIEPGTGLSEPPGIFVAKSVLAHRSPG